MQTSNNVEFYFASVLIFSAITSLTKIEYVQKGPLSVRTKGTIYLGTHVVNAIVISKVVHLSR